MEPIRRNELIAIAAALFVAWAALALIDAPAPKSSADFAAWVQGIGSFAAVAVAAVVGLWPVWSERRRREKEWRAFNEVVYLAAVEALGPLQWVERAIKDRNPSNLGAELRRLAEPERTDPLRHILAEPPNRWPSMSLYLSATKLERAAVALSRLEVPREVVMYPTYEHQFWDTAHELTAECAARLSMLRLMRHRGAG